VGGFGSGLKLLSKADREKAGDHTWAILSNRISVPYPFPEHQIRDDNFFIPQASFLLA
jgi:hypothetical protein